MARTRRVSRGNQGHEGAGRLSTFGGVFTPSILTILGVIMYLRFGWVVGNVGLVGTLAIVSISTLITFLTGLSISAIATDQQVKVGGAYYMISRSLGIESGGAVGIPLYFAQALSVALYTVGFAESLTEVLPGADETLIGIVTTLVVALIALRSAEAAIKVQYFIMAAIGLSLVSLVAGSPVGEPMGAGAAAEGGEDFWVVFAVFFPAVTGIMAGVNLSGDLKDAARSIPVGTMGAIAAGYVIYMLLPILLAYRADAESLSEYPLIMQQIAFWGPAILLGVWGATLSSAVGSILGAPRVLQALARDGVLPKALNWLGKGHGPNDEPRFGTAVTLLIALTAVALGNLNIIAPILTMFFLTTYGVLNITAGIERFLGNPSYRPRFNVHWIFSLAGAVGCVSVMFLINPVATVIAGSVVVGIFLWLERRELTSTWGDVRRGIWMALTRTAVHNIKDVPDPKNWRPNLLVLSGAPRRRWHLIEFAGWLSHNRGILTVSTILQSSDVAVDRLRAMETSIADYLLKRKIRSLVRIIPAPSILDGARRLVDAYGLGQLVPNTIMLGASERPEHLDDFCEMIEYFHESRRNVAVLRQNEEKGFGSRRLIDVWWGGLKKNGGLMLILSYLLKTSIDWRGAIVRIKMVVPDENAAQAARENLASIIRQSRTGAIPEVIVADGRPFEQILRESSRVADVVFLGMAAPRTGFSEYYQNTMDRTAGLPTTLFVLASEGMAFREVMLK
jgi:amino acid transporter